MIGGPSEAQRQCFCTKKFFVKYELLLASSVVSLFLSILQHKVHGTIQPDFLSFLAKSLFEIHSLLRQPL